MSTTMNPPRSGRKEASFNVGRGGPIMGMVLAFVSMLLIAIIWRSYQQAFAFTKGLDKNNPDYATYWYPMLVANLVILPIAAVVWYLRMWSSANKSPASQMTRSEEGRRIWTLWLIIAAVCTMAFVAGSFQAEQDGSWHQVVLRDSSFTPSHIMLFYGSFPLLIYLVVGAYLYARTRLPHMYGGDRFPVSFGLAISGAVLLMFQVAMNEFGHSFFQGEELFSAPLHWGFVIFAYLLAGIFAVWFETLPRAVELAKQERAEAQGVRVEEQAGSTAATTTV